LPLPKMINRKPSASDPYPLLSDRQKIRWTQEAGEPPFDGTCHHCGTAASQFETRCRLELPEQPPTEPNRDTVQQHAAAELAWSASPAVARWTVLDLPLWLCEHCQRTFVRQQKRNRRLQFWKQVLLLAIIGGSVAWLFDHELVTPMAAVCGVLGAIGFAIRFRFRRTTCPVTVRFLRHIRWMSDVLDGADEFRLTVRRTKRRHSHRSWFSFVRPNRAESAE